MLTDEDIKLYKEISSSDCSHVVHDDLNSTVEWCETTK